MTNEKLQQIQVELQSLVGLGGSVAGMIVPGQAAYIALGKALAVMAPEIYQDAVELFQKSEPAPEDLAGLASDIHDLLNPENA